MEKHDRVCVFLFRLFQNENGQFYTAIRITSFRSSGIFLEMGELVLTKIEEKIVQGEKFTVYTNPETK